MQEMHRFSSEQLPPAKLKSDWERQQASPCRKRASTTTTFHLYGLYGRVPCPNLIAVHHLCLIASCAWLGAYSAPGLRKAIFQILFRWIEFSTATTSPRWACAYTN